MLKITYRWQLVELPYEKKSYAIFYGIDENNCVVATCKAEPWGRTNGGDSDPIRPFISGFHVDPLCRREGVGGGLIECVIQSAESLNIPSLAMYVRKQNAEAIRLYSRYGFTPVLADCDDLLFARRVGGGMLIQMIDKDGPVLRKKLSQLHLLLTDYATDLTVDGKKVCIECGAVAPDMPALERAHDSNCPLFLFHADQIVIRAGGAT